MRSVDLHSDCENINTLKYKLEIEFSFARKSDRLLCLIVGYGSKGGTHKIRNNVIELLEEYKGKKIKDYILGNDIDIFNSKYHSFLGKDRIPEELKKTTNPGIILVYL